MCFPAVGHEGAMWSRKGKGVPPRFIRRILRRSPGPERLIQAAQKGTTPDEAIAGIPRPSTQDRTTGLGGSGVSALDPGPCEVVQYETGVRSTSR